MASLTALCRGERQLARSGVVSPQMAADGKHDQTSGLRFPGGTSTHSATPLLLGCFFGDMDQTMISVAGLFVKNESLVTPDLFKRAQINSIIYRIDFHFPTESVSFCFEGTLPQYHSKRQDVQKNYCTFIELIL